MNYSRSGIQDRVADEIRVQLVRRRMTQAVLAARLGENAPWVSRRLTGDVPLDVDDLDRIAQALDVPIAAFFGIPDQGSITSLIEEPVPQELAAAAA